MIKDITYILYHIRYTLRVIFANKFHNRQVKRLGRDFLSQEKRSMRAKRKKLNEFNFCNWQVPFSTALNKCYNSFRSIQYMFRRLPFLWLMHHSTNKLLDKLATLVVV